MASDKVKTFTDSNFDDETKQGRRARGLLGRVVRAVPPAGADGRRAGVGVRRPRHGGQDERRREPRACPGSFAIRGIPTLLLFKDGQLAETIVGLRRRKTSRQMIERHL